MVRTREPGFDFDLVVITRGAQIAAVDFGDSEQDSVLAFEIAIAETGLAAVIDTGHFHPNEVVGVVHDTHLVSLGIAYANSGDGGGHWF